MDTKSGYPFWVLANGLLPSYPRIERDERCDVAIIGGGITGALIADELSRHGHDVVVIEQRDIGWGSTAASTAMLQYEIDEPMRALADRYDELTAALAYTTCVEAVEGLIRLARDLGDVGLKSTGSVYLASTPRHLPQLAEEQALRTRYGLPSKFLSAAAVLERFEITAPGALYSNTAAVVDPYRFTCRLLARVHRRGTRIYDRSRVERMEPTSRGVTLHTDQGCRIRAGHLIVAAGYEGQRWIPTRVARNRSSYAVVTDPLDRADLKKLGRAIFWESARPYHYLRTTTDRRLIIGGEDDRVDVPAKRDKRVHQRAKLLYAYAQELFPSLTLTPAFAWAGTFAETEDGLPFFGPHERVHRRVLFAMGYGGNGITYSYLGARVLRAILEKQAHPLRELYAFDRLER